MAEQLREAVSFKEMKEMIEVCNMRVEGYMNRLSQKVDIVNKEIVS